MWFGSRKRPLNLSLAFWVVAYERFDCTCCPVDHSNCIVVWSCLSLTTSNGCLACIEEAETFVSVGQLAHLLDEPILDILDEYKYMKYIFELRMKD